MYRLQHRGGKRLACNVCSTLRVVLVSVGSTLDRASDCIELYTWIDDAFDNVNNNVSIMRLEPKIHSHRIYNYNLSEKIYRCTTFLFPSLILVTMINHHHDTTDDHLHVFRVDE